MVNRYFLELSFRGTTFHGWQTQPNAHSVQRAIEDGLSMLLKQQVKVTGAGRTDTGVHASYFVLHFDSSPIQIPSQLVKKLNSCLGPEISIRTFSKQAKDSHARFDARSRTYKYVILRNKQPFTRDLGYYYHGNLDIGKMNSACMIIKKTIDFTSFAKLHSDTKTNICKVSHAKWSEKEGYLVFTIRADRFLRNMVRSITGTILDVGKGKISLEEFQEIIDSRDNQTASSSAPAKGLFLTDIRYPRSFSLNNPRKNRFLPFV